MASGTVGVAVNVGGTIGVSVGMGVDVAAGSPPPQALKATTITMKRMMNLGRTNFLQKYEVPHELAVRMGELYTLTSNVPKVSPGELSIHLNLRDVCL